MNKILFFFALVALLAVAKPSGGWGGWNRGWNGGYGGRGWGY